MKAQTSQGILHLGWQYTQTGKELGIKGGKIITEQDVTICSIRNSEKEEIARAEVVRYFKDLPNKAIARRKTFEIAISSFSREDRRELWNVFLKEVKQK